MGWFGCVFVTGMASLGLVYGSGDLVWARRVGASDRHVRIGQSIGRYRTLEPSLPLQARLMAMGFVHSVPLVTAMLHPHSFARTGG